MFLVCGRTCQEPSLWSDPTRPFCLETPHCPSGRAFPLELVGISRILCWGRLGQPAWRSHYSVSRVSPHLPVFCTAPHPCPGICPVCPEPICFDHIFSCRWGGICLTALGYGRISGGLISSFYRLFTNPPNFNSTSHLYLQQNLMPLTPDPFLSFYGENCLALGGFPVQTLIFQPRLLC